MYDIYEKLLDVCKFTGYSILAIWLFSYIRMNNLTEGKEVIEHILDFYIFLDKNILEFTLAVAILEIISALSNVFLKPIFSENNFKQDYRMVQLEYKIEQLENVLRSRQDK